jgi:hypothetical protein
MSDLENTESAEQVINKILLMALEEQVKNPPINPYPQQEYVYQQLLLIQAFFEKELTLVQHEIIELSIDPNNQFKISVLAKALNEKKEAAFSFIFDNRKHLTI